MIDHEPLLDQHVRARLSPRAHGSIFDPVSLDRQVLVRAEARVGTVLDGRYELVRLIDVGASAAVYEARRDGHCFAAKLLHEEIAEDADAKRRFLREAYVANRIAHPGVVPVLDGGEAQTAFLIMELLEGNTLEQECRKQGGRLAPERVVGVMLALLSVLEAAHAVEVVHRDLKPANVFLAKDGSLKVLDFGIARLLDQPRTTPTGDGIGTAEFSAPEQAAGRVWDVDARSDLYAVGAIAYRLITGRFVHDARNPLERLVLAATRSASSVRAVAPDLDEDLAHVIDVALSFDKDRRWRSATAMRRALQGLEKKAGLVDASGARTPS
jgi:serine/threonine-protein kinase